MKPIAPLARITGTLIATALLAIVLAIAVTNAFRTRAEIADTFDRQTRIGQAQVTLEGLQRLQIDEENSVRGFTSTRDPFYKQQYDNSVADFTRKEGELRRALADADLKTTLARTDDYDGSQQEWRRGVATPLLAHPNQKLPDIDKRSKFYSDYQNRVAAGIRSDLADRNQQLVRDTLDQVNRTLYVSAFWFMVFGLLAILFNAYRSRLNRELVEERTTTDILQRAFRSEHVPLPNCDVGSAYSSAGSHLAVGGDVFDVYRLSDSLALILIADVSGKGVDAAVLTAFIKFTIRGIALRRREPGAILAEFNTAFAHTVDNPYLFVSMFVGVLDTESMILKYASAGHDSAFIRRSNGVQQLAVTGPVLGVMEEPFGTQTVHLEDGDIVVLSTDGLTEARNRRGEFLREQGAMDLIERSSSEPQRLADELVAQVKALGGNSMRDDLAILAIRVHDAQQREAEQHDGT
jgi:sigma-B regulation protein RsbU (phosphoserine phosphatase)